MCLAASTNARQKLVSSPVAGPGTAWLSETKTDGTARPTRRNSKLHSAVLSICDAREDLTFDGYCNAMIDALQGIIA